MKTRSSEGHGGRQDQITEQSDRKVRYGWRWLPPKSVGEASLGGRLAPLGPDG